MTTVSAVNKHERLKELSKIISNAEVFLYYSQMSNINADEDVRSEVEYKRMVSQARLDAARVEARKLAAEIVQEESLP